MNNKTVVKRLKKKLLTLRTAVKTGAEGLTKNVNRTMNGITNKINDIINSAADEETLRNQALFGDAYVGANTLKENLTKELSVAFKSVPADFFESGEQSAESFCDGFQKKISSASQQLTSSVEKTFAQMQPTIAVSLAPGKGTSQVYNSANYNFYSSGLSVTEQLEQARRSQLLNVLRG